MAFTSYAAILRLPAPRQALLTGLLIRIPMWAAAVVLTLHVVGHLHRSYTAAGVVVTAATVAAAVSGPWRGRRLDRVGLRPAVLPSLVVLTLCWSVAPWVGYWLLLPLAFVAGLFIVPTFSIIRQVLISEVEDHQRRTALVMDSVAVELSFMVGPVLGVLAATYWSTPVVLCAAELLSVVGSLALWVQNPDLGHGAEEHDGRVGTSGRAWMNPAVLAVLGASFAATIVLTGSDVGTVAALRAMHEASSIGWVLGVWGAGSAIGGIAYGALPRQPPAFWLLGGLAITTGLVALAPDRFWFAALVFLSGLCCAPTITATIDDLSRAVPLRVRGEAMGWHGSALTGGSALGAPVIGLAIDHGGWQSGFVVAGVCGAVFAAFGIVLGVVRRGSLAGPVGSGVDLEAGVDLAGRPRAVQRVEVQPGSAAGE